MQSTLNILIANLAIASANAKVYHWYIEGENFFILHAKFEELYNFYNEHLDNLTERILMLEKEAVVGYSNYLKIAQIKETKNPKSAHEVVSETLNTLEIIINTALNVKAEVDEETADYLQGFIYELQKLSWMYSRNLK